MNYWWWFSSWYWRGGDCHNIWWASATRCYRESNPQRDKETVEETEAHCWIPPWHAQSFATHISISTSELHSTHQFVVIGSSCWECDTTQDISMIREQIYLECLSWWEPLSMLEIWGMFGNLLMQRPFWNGETVTRLWDGIWDDIKENMVIATQYDDGRQTSMHKSHSGSLAWRTCHDKLLKRGVFKELKL